jgi:hypothetical protein
VSLHGKVQIYLRLWHATSQDAELMAHFDGRGVNDLLKVLLLN